MIVERLGDSERLEQRQRGRRGGFAGLVATVIAALEDDRVDATPREGQRGRGCRRSPPTIATGMRISETPSDLGRLRGRTPPSTDRWRQRRVGRHPYPPPVASSSSRSSRRARRVPPGERALVGSSGSAGSGIRPHLDAVPLLDELVDHRLVVFAWRGSAASTGGDRTRTPRRSE